MNKRQKIVQQAFLDDEEKVIKRLKSVYGQSLKDITAKSEALQKDIERLDTLAKLSIDDEEKEKILSQRRSKVYQKKYQESLKKQVSDILDNMHENEFKTVSDYLNKCYEQGFLGAMYDLQGQGIPLCFPLDQEAMVRAVQLDSKISQGLYSRLGEDVSLLKRKITAQVSRGISTGMTFPQIAQQIAGYTNIGFNNAVRIARTEGHRIQCQSGMDACYKARDKGADVVKQWDSTLDARTRDSHVKVDGEIRELDEPFSNGLMFAGDPHGSAAEVVNCRCALLQRARWAVGDSFTKMDNETGEIVDFKDIDDYNEFKKKYLKQTKDLTNTSNDVIIQPKKSDDPYYTALVDKLNQLGVEYNGVTMHEYPLSEEEIINVLAGGDLTQGSCASLGLAYIGQKGGMNVLDFRGGGSREFFSKHLNLVGLSKFPEAITIRETARSYITAGNKVLKHVEKGKEYYFVAGRHAAIVRKTDDNLLQYLELQSPNASGWTNFDGNPRYTLSTRFGCPTASGYNAESFMIDVDSLKGSEDFKSLLGYINTAEDKQRKGKYGQLR